MQYRHKLRRLFLIGALVASPLVLIEAMAGLRWLACSPFPTAITSPTSASTVSSEQTFSRVKQLADLKQPFLRQSLWLNDNEILTFQDDQGELDIGSLIYRLNVETGEKTFLEKLTREWSHHRNPEWAVFNMHPSPDGKWVLGPAGTRKAPLWKMTSLDGKQVHTWHRDPAVSSMGSVVWLPDSTGFLELSKLGRLLQVFHRGQARPEALSVKSYTGKGVTMQWDCLSLSRDGKTLYSYSGDSDTPTGSETFQPQGVYARFDINANDVWYAECRIDAPSKIWPGTFSEFAIEPNTGHILWRWTSTDVGMDTRGPILLVTESDGSHPRPIYPWKEIPESKDDARHVAWGRDDNTFTFYSGQGYWAARR